MSEFLNTNPNLLNPMNTQAQTVPPLAGITQPLPIILQEKTEYYFCTMQNHHMTRNDGKRLAFIFNTFATKDVSDINYLNAEINANNPYLRKATDDEIRMYKMRIDPKGTLAAELTPQIEEKVRNELEAEINASLEQRLKNAGIILTDEQKAQLTVATSVPAMVSDDAKLNGSSALEKLKAQLAGGVQSGTGTILGGISGTDKMVNNAPYADPASDPANKK